MKLVAAASCAALLAAAAPAGASFHTFQIEQVYSNADGTVQYIVLHESAGFNGENFMGGLPFTSTHAGVTKTFMFPNHLPGSSTSNQRFLIATQGFAAQAKAAAAGKLYGYPDPPPPPDPPPAKSAAPDFIIPDGFLPTDGGTINYAGVDQMTFGPLPTDGVSALQPDIDALDTGRIAGWTRTTKSFRVFPTQALGGAGVNPVCRFLIPPEHGNSHFFSASPDECNAVFGKIGQDPNYSGYIEETASAFFIALPDVSTGACPVGTTVVYRLFNNRPDANHRYTTDPAIKAAMIAKGYIAEGYGPDAAIMCAP